MIRLYLFSKAHAVRPSERQSLCPNAISQAQVALSYFPSSHSLTLRRLLFKRHLTSVLAQSNSACLLSRVSTHAHTHAPSPQTAIVTTKFVSEASVTRELHSQSKKSRRSRIPRQFVVFVTLVYCV